jgi:cobalamin biosynthetic protein CobC
MVTPAPLTHAMRERLGPWAISGLALAAMASAYGDPSWMADMRARLDAAARELDTQLREAGLTIVGGTALFRLVATPMAVHVQTTLARHGIAVRRFPGDPRHLRIGIPPDAEARERLMAGVRDALAS